MEQHGSGHVRSLAPAPFATFDETVDGVLTHLGRTGAVAQWAIFRASPEHDANVLLSTTADEVVAIEAGDIVRWSTSFCRRTIEDDARAVPDARREATYRDLPLVSTGLIRAYVGVPFGVPDREAFGTICGFDAEPREPEELERVLPVLELCARMLATVLERDARIDDAAELAARMREASLRDQLTGLGNRHRWDAALQELGGRRRIGVLVADLDDFKSVNDRHGHLAGDRMLHRAGRAVLGAVRHEDVVCRLGGDEFAVLLVDCDEAGAEALAARVREALEAAAVPASVGVATGAGEPERLLERADREMYARKRERRDGRRPEHGT